MSKKADVDRARRYARATAKRAAVQKAQTEFAMATAGARHGGVIVLLAEPLPACYEQPSVLVTAAVTP